MQRLCQLIPNAPRIFSSSLVAVQSRPFLTTTSRLLNSPSGKTEPKKAYANKIMDHGLLKHLKRSSQPPQEKTPHEIWATRSAQILNTISPPKDAYAGRRLIPNLFDTLSFGAGQGEVFMLQKE